MKQGEVSRRAIERWKRAEFVKTEIDALVAEAQRIVEQLPPDAEARIAAINAEVEVRVESLREMNRERLLDEIEYWRREPAPAPPPRRVRLVGWLVERRRTR